MQLWLRPYRQSFLANVLCDEKNLLSENGIEIYTEFEKGDRLKWVDVLVKRAFEKAFHQDMNTSKVVVSCANSELFERNWASHQFGAQIEIEGSIAQLFLGSYATNLGLPLQWLIDEWQTLYPVRGYHRGLLKKYHRLTKQIQTQLLFAGSSELHFRDPLLATCTDIELEYHSSDFIHLNSDEEIKPPWMTAEFTKPECEPMLY